MAYSAMTFEIPPAELARFSQKMKTLAQETGKDSNEVMRMAMRSLVGTLSSWTPPRKRQQGEGTLSNDIQKVASGVSYSRIGAKSDAVELLLLLRLPVHKENVAAAARLIKKEGSLGVAFSSVLTQQEKMLAKVHKDARNSRGRVGRSIAIHIDGLRLNRLRVPEERLADYIKKNLLKVGRLKAGWNAAAAKFGVRVAKWAWRHGTSEGSARDALEVDGGGYVEATNSVPYVGRQAGMVKRAVASATRNVETRLRKMMAKQAAKFNRSS